MEQIPAIPDETRAMAEAALPGFLYEDNAKRNYLSFRLCGFNMTEACRFAGIHRRTIYRWIADDEDFANIERTGIVELRRKFSQQAITFEFTRNLRLILEKDRRVIKKSLEDGTKLTKEEHQYLRSIRQYYTPQQLKLLEQLNSGEGDMGWDELILIARRYNGQGQGQQSFRPAEGSVIQAQYQESPDEKDWDAKAATEDDSEGDVSSNEELEEPESRYTETEDVDG